MVTTLERRGVPGGAGGGPSTGRPRVREYLPIPPQIPRKPAFMGLKWGMGHRAYAHTDTVRSAIRTPSRCIRGCVPRKARTRPRKAALIRINGSEAYSSSLRAGCIVYPMQHGRTRGSRESTHTDVFGIRLCPETHERLKSLRVAYETLCVYKGGSGRTSHDACMRWMLNLAELEVQDEARRLGIDLDELARMMGRV